MIKGPAESSMGKALFVALMFTFYYGPAASIVSAGEIVCSLAVPEWSRTDPPVDRGHIFCGDINRKGRATGYHHRPDGQDPPTARIGRISRRSDTTGVYISDQVEVWDGNDWRRKKHISSFFPDHCSPRQVLASIAFAAGQPSCQLGRGKWRGWSAPAIAQNADSHCRGLDGRPLVVEGYWQGRAGDRVATAWPRLRSDRLSCD